MGTSGLARDGKSRDGEMRWELRFVLQQSNQNFAGGMDMWRRRGQNSNLFDYNTAYSPTAMEGDDVGKGSLV